jgi:hypothetical protein
LKLINKCKVESVAQGRATVLHVSHRAMQLMGVSVLKFFHTSSAVKLLSDNFICMHELVYFTGKFIVLA